MYSLFVVFVFAVWVGIVTAQLERRWQLKKCTLLFIAWSIYMACLLWWKGQ